MKESENLLEGYYYNKESRSLDPEDVRGLVNQYFWDEEFCGGLAVVKDIETDCNAIVCQDNDEVKFAIIEILNFITLLLQDTVEHVTFDEDVEEPTDKITIDPKLAVLYLKHDIKLIEEIQGLMSNVLVKKEGDKTKIVFLEIPYRRFQY